MDNAPERIYIKKSSTFMDYYLTKVRTNEVEYIRADIVESRIKELEEALEEIREAATLGTLDSRWIIEVTEKALTKTK